MPTVNLNKKEFDKLVGKKLPLDKLKDRISMLGTDLEDIKGNEIEVEVFPDRPDMLSEQGFARAFSSFIGVKKGLRKYNVKKSGYKVIVDKSVSMRPYTACAIVRNLKFDDEKIRQIMQIQEKLAVTHGRNRKKSAYGLYPIKGITFPIHYIAKDPHKVKFMPLGFKKEMTAIKVEQVHPKGREYKHLVEGWKKYPFFIDKKGKVMSFLPYTNSEDTGKIDEKTKEVFIECTGTDLENVTVALNIFVTMLADMGGTIYSMDIMYGKKKVTTPDLTPKKMKIDIKYVNKVLGLSLKENEIKKYLERMGHDYKNKTVLIPAYRYDVMHQVDLIEDIAIAYGYENFKEEIPNVSTLGEENEFEKFKRKVKDILIGFGYLECNSYNLISGDILNKMEAKLDNVKVLNPVNVEYDTLRSWIIPSLMKILSENKHHEYPQKIFEVGHVFGKQEFERVGLLSCHGSASFTESKQVLDYLFNSLGLKYKLEEVDHGSFIKGRVGRVYCKGKKVGFIGEVNPKVLENFSLDVPVVGFEINLTELFR
tara:strand:- start:290 stop:1900 length:1611 start_codon:yes stop_codon:yes gene_type:complete